MATENGSGNTAIVAIVVLVVIGLIAFFLFFNPGTTATPAADDGPDIEVQIGT